MKLNKYHKQVLSIALDIFEHNGDDSWMDIRNNPNTRKAYNQLLKASKPPQYKKIKVKKIPRGAIIMGRKTSKDVINADLLKLMQKTP